MIFVGLILLGIAIANGMEPQAFIDVLESSDALALIFVVALFVALIGDLRRI